MIPLSTIVEHASHRPFDSAIESDTEQVTWASLRDRVRAVRAWLADHLEPAEAHRVVVYGNNTVPFAIATAAAVSLGLPWVGIDPTRDRATAEEQLRIVEPTVVITDTSVAHGAALAELGSQREAIVIDLASRMSGRIAHFDDVVSYPHAGRSWSLPPFRALGFTSGTTGTPKLFVRTRKTENQRLVFLRDHFHFGPKDIYLVTSPLAHASGHVWASAALALGATVILGDSSADRITEAVEHGRVTAAFMVPPVLDAVLASAAAHPELDLSSLRALLTGGRQLSERTIRLAGQRLGEILHFYYATSETGINTMVCPGDLAHSPFTAGQPMPGFQLRIVDPETRTDRPSGEVGLIAIAGPMNMDGYVGAESDMLRRDDMTYVVTSDYGHLDEAGRLFIVARGDSLPGSGTVDVVRIESAIKEIEDVVDACLIRRRTGDHSVEVVAAVTIAAGEQSALAAARRRLSDLLPDSVDAHAVIAVRKIPYNTAGKVDSRALADLLSGTRTLATA